jgi:hypothetical protein
MSSTPGINPNISQIPQPLADVGSLAYVAQLLKQAIDSLAGFRGVTTNRAVTFNDLVTYGILGETEVGSPSSSGVTGGLAAEVIARISGDNVNGAAISAETVRAEAAEATLTSDVALLTPLTTANKGQYKGTTTNDNATAGNIGEEFEVTILVGSAINATAGTPLNVASQLVTAGDWDISGIVVTAPAGTTVTSVVVAAISTTSASLPTPPAGGYTKATTSTAAGAVNALATGTTRVSLASSTTVYLIADVGFATSTLGVYGILRGRRMR